MIGRMGSDEESASVLAEARQHHLTQVNDVLRRPGMYGRDEMVETFGPPSLWIGSTNPFYPKALAYTTADRDDGLVCFHLWNAFANTAPESGLKGVHPEPVLLAVRYRPGPFASAFSFTPEGLRRRPTVCS